MSKREEVVTIVDAKNKAKYATITGTGIAEKTCEFVGFLESNISRGLDTFYLVYKKSGKTRVFNLTDFIRWNREEIDREWYKKNGITRKV